MAASVDVVATGGTLTLTLDVAADETARVLVDVEVYDAAGRKTFQRWWDGQQVRAGTDQTYEISWVIPAGEAAGEHTVKVGIFNEEWAGLVHWNDDAASFQIESSTAPTTSSPVSTTKPTLPVSTTTRPPTSTAGPTTTAAAPTSTADPTTTAAPTTTAPPPGPPPAPPAGAQFFADFSSPSDVDRFRFELVYKNDHAPLTPWFADHDEACHTPDTSRTVHVDRRDEWVFHCAPNGPDTGHMMTSIDTAEYAQIDFMPNQVFSDVSKICWDTNETEFGTRKWYNVLVLPEADFQANGQTMFYAEAGFDVSSIAGGRTQPAQAFMLITNAGLAKTSVGTQLLGSNFDWFTTTDVATRRTACVIDNGNGTVTFQQERPANFVQCRQNLPTCQADAVFERVLPGTFPDGPVRVIWQDTAYDPPKSHPDHLNTNTYHWDNFLVQ